jgi:hypothetical protein
MASLTYALPELRAAEQRLRALAASRGIIYKFADEGEVRSESDTVRIMGYRDAEYANYVKAFRAKYGMTRQPVSKYEWRPINAFGTSHHNFGAAFDALMMKGTLAQLGALAPAVGLVWGGTFARKDYPHFQLPITLNEAKARWLARGNLPGVAVGAPVAKQVGRADVGALVLVAVLGVILVASSRGGLRVW